MRIRSVKPEFWRSEDIASLSIADRLLFIGLWSYVDDSGVGVDRLALISADLFAADLERDPEEVYGRVRGGLRELSDRGLITRYEVDGKRYLHITKWRLHQRIEKPTKSRYPLPDEAVTCGNTDLPDASPTPPGSLPEESGAGAGEQGSSGTGEDQKTSSSGERAPRVTATRLPEPFPLTDELAKWGRENCPGVPRSEHDRFVDYWRGVGGAKGRKADWVATWRNWMRRAQDDIDAGRRPPASGRRSTTDQRVEQAQSLQEWARALDESDPSTAALPGAAGPAEVPRLATVTALAIEGTPA